MRALLLAAALALGAGPAMAQLFGSQELLDPDKAFRISARALDARNVEVTFQIADGYYMYRDRFSFATESGRPLTGVEIPRGKIKVDQFFGKQETFRDFVRIRVQVSDAEAARLSQEIAREIERKVEYPGSIRVTVIRESRATDYAR